MENCIKKVISKWKSEGVKLNLPATNADIENTEAVLNFKFPVDFKEFYLQANGFDEWDMLHNSYISLWPLDRIIDEVKNWGELEFIGICDWAVNCYAIGFYRQKAGFFKLHNKLDDAESVDITFAELIAAIDRDDNLIY
jgi:hypothetical protein